MVFIRADLLSLHKKLICNLRCNKGIEAGDFSTGEWLVGMGYDPSAFPDGKHITKFDLDTISTRCNRRLFLREPRDTALTARLSWPAVSRLKTSYKRPF